MSLTTEIYTTAEVITAVIPNADFDPSLLDKRLLKCQRKYLRDLIGEDFYDEILTEFAAGTLTADNLTLLNDYIIPMLSYYLVYESLPDIRTNITSSGVVELSQEFISPSSRGDYASVRNQILADAEDWRVELLRFIKDTQKDDSSKYPEFTNKDKNYFNKYGIIPY